MNRIKRNDTVMVRTGKDKGKTGKVIKIFPEKESALVQGINFVTKHLRKTREDMPWGRVQKESPLHLSNLMLYCARCSKRTRIGIRALEDGTKSRFCKRCNEVI